MWTAEPSIWDVLQYVDVYLICYLFNEGIKGQLGEYANEATKEKAYHLIRIISSIQCTNTNLCILKCTREKKFSFSTKMIFNPSPCEIEWRNLNLTQSKSPPMTLHYVNRLLISIHRNSVEIMQMATWQILFSWKEFI